MSLFTVSDEPPLNSVQDQQCFSSYTPVLLQSFGNIDESWYVFVYCYVQGRAGRVD